MPVVYNALDIATLSSSFGEGFPNVVGEAVAFGVYCPPNEYESLVARINKRNRQTQLTSEVLCV